MIKFNIGEDVCKLVFKYGTAEAPTLECLVPEVRRELRDFMEIMIQSSKMDNRHRPLHTALRFDTGMLGSQQLRPRLYRMCSAFIVNLSKGHIEEGPFTSVCVPGDHFVKEIARQKSLGMLARWEPSVGRVALKAYHSRRAGNV